MSIAAYQGVCPTCRHDHSEPISALASGSGDHGELARLADDLRKFEHYAIGSLKIDMTEVRRIIAACDAHAALLAENAALRAANTEAERKLAEAVAVIRDIAGTPYTGSDWPRSRAATHLASKEAERG